MGLASFTAQRRRQNLAKKAQVPVATNSMTRQQLRDICKQRGIKRASHMTKDQMARAINGMR